MEGLNCKMEKSDMVIEELSLEELLEYGYTPDSLIQKDIWTEDTKEKKDIQIRLNEILEQMTERERKVFSLRLGLEDGVVRSLEEVAQILGVTKERILQIERKALHRVCHPRYKRQKRLKDYLDN